MFKKISHLTIVFLMPFSVYAENTLYELQLGDYSNEMNSIQNEIIKKNNQAKERLLNNKTQYQSLKQKNSELKKLNDKLINDYIKNEESNEIISTLISKQNKETLNIKKEITELEKELIEQTNQFQNQYEKFKTQLESDFDNRILAYDQLRDENLKLTQLMQDQQTKSAMILEELNKSRESLLKRQADIMRTFDNTFFEKINNFKKHQDKLSKEAEKL